MSCFSVGSQADARENAGEPGKAKATSASQPGEMKTQVTAGESCCSCRSDSKSDKHCCPELAKIAEDLR